MDKGIIEVPVPLSVINATRKLLPGREYLHTLIQDDSGPARVAVDYLTATGKRVELKFADLKVVTDCLAKRVRDVLHKLHLRCRDTIIPVLVPQSPELYVAWIAILKAGSAFCPLSLDAPPERLKYILKDVEAELVLTTQEYQSSVAEIRPDIKVLCLDLKNLESGDEQTISSEICHNDELPKPDDLAYVMYTSGSTGLPKGVRISHKSVTQSLLAHDEHIPSFERFLQFASPTFDVSVFETFFPLFRGATIVSRDREHMLADLPGTIRDLKVDAAELTPTVAHTLLRSRKAAPCLKLLLTIGEMLTKHVIEEFGDSSEQDGILYAMYGPTEASIHCTIAPKISASSSIHSIGVPLATVTAFVLKNANEQLVERAEIAPQGDIGELAITGQLASGYLNRPEQTEAAFIDLPGYGLIYRTGDRARVLPNGELEILGRIAFGQVKLRGQRVELGEIEQVVCKASGVDLAIVTIIDDVLVAFCAGDDDLASVDEIRSICKAWLPRFMQPDDIISLGRNVPRLSSGKLDKNKMAETYTQRKYQSSLGDHIQDLDGVELEILACTQAVLGTKISSTASLWGLGLDSLQAIQIASRLRDSYPSVRVTEVLDAGSVEDLAAKLRRIEAHTPLNESQLIEETQSWRGAQESAYKMLAAHSSKTETIVPCTPMQTALLSETIADSGLNFNVIELRVSSDTSFDAVKEAFCILARENEILRSGFLHIGKDLVDFVQIIWDKLELHHELSLLHPFRLDLKSKQADSAIIIHIHHALYDGWSWDLIMHDVEGILANEYITPRPQFRDISRRQRSLFATRNADNLEYWQKCLYDMASTPLPNLCSVRCGGDTLRSEYILSTHLNAISSLSRRLHISRSAVVSAAFSLILSCYTDSLDVSIGIVSSGRTLEARMVHQAIGPCISTLPMRLELSNVQKVQDLLLYAHRVQYELLRHGEISLRDIREASGMSSEMPIFDTLFVWQEGPELVRSGHRALEVVEVRDALVYGLVLEAEPKGNNLKIKLTYKTSLIPLDQAVLFLSQLDHAVAFLIQKVESDWRQVWDSCSFTRLSVSNEDYRSFDGKFNLTTTIENLANENPEHIAIEFVRDFEEGSGETKVEYLTYGDLRTRAQRVASSLIARRGMCKDEIICIWAEKSVELYITILGVVFSGAAYMCIDSRTPTDRVRQILIQSNCELLLHDETTDVKHVTHVCATTTLAGLASMSSENLPFEPPRTHFDDLAYANFTSGSTGNPKGVLVTRRNLLSNIDCLSQIYPCQQNSSRMLQACSPAFDVSVFEIFWTWHMGMRLCSAKTDVMFRDLEKLINRMDITHVSMTPSVAALIAPTNVPNVQFLVTAGEPMNLRVFDQWTGSCRLYQGYGPSETTNICNVRPMVNLNDFANNVGPPLPNTSIFVCLKGNGLGESGELRLVPKGAVGEIWIGGDQVGRGYTDPALTAKSFFRHPDYGRLYRSGDIGRVLADGSLVLLGREDDQVKVRGQRVDLNGISSTLVKSPLVKDATTMIHRTEGSTKLISFWISASSDGKVSTNEIIPQLYEFLLAKLPNYMVPDLLIPVVASLPLTRQGKVDKRKLIDHLEMLEPSLRKRMYRNSSEVEASEALIGRESEIALAVSAVTRNPLDSIKRNTSFYALGLDSISAISVSQRLRKAGILNADVSTVLQNSSVRRLASAIGVASTTPAPRKVPRADSNSIEKLLGSTLQQEIIAKYEDAGLEVEKILPCTSIQQSMLAGRDVGYEKAYYNEIRFQINGDISKLMRSWEIMILRHQILRTGFVMSDSGDAGYVQIVLRHFELPWFKKTIPNEKGPDSLFFPPYYFIYHEDHHIDFDATGDEKMVNESTSLTLQIHHALYDAEAISLLLREVETCYRGLELEEPTSFDQYLRYMINLDRDEIDEFWKKKLDGYEPISFFHRFEKKSGQNSKISLQRELQRDSKVPLSAINIAAQKCATTTAVVLQAGWAKLLSAVFQSSDVCFGNVFSGRNLDIDKVDAIIAPCFNALPIRISIQAAQTNRDLIERLHALNLEILPHQPSSLRRIQKQMGFRQKFLFDTMLLVQREERQLGKSLWSIERESGDMQFPMIIEAIPDSKSDRLIIRVISQSQLLSNTQVEQMFQMFDELLEQTTCFLQSKALEFDIPQLMLMEMNLDEQESAKRSQKSLNNHFSDQVESFSTMESLIRQIFAKQAKLSEEKITKTIPMFRFGLDSIDAIHIAAQLRRNGYVITGADVLEASTVKRLATLCERPQNVEQQWEEIFDFDEFDQLHRREVSNSLDVDFSAIRPCTNAQIGIITQFLRSDGRLYFNTVDLKLQQDVDIPRLKQAWTDVVLRHDMLRTGFIHVTSKTHPFAMVTYRPGVWTLPWTEVEKQTTKKNELASEHLLESISQPPYRLELCTEGDDRYLSLLILHALYDAQSLDLIFADVTALYHKKALPMTSPITPYLGTILTRTNLHGIKAKDFWTELGRNVVSTRFPNLTIYRSQSPKFYTVNQRISVRLSQRIHNRCKELGASLHALCQCAYALLLSAYTGETRVTFGIILTGRLSEHGLNDICFPSMNTIPVFCDTSRGAKSLLTHLSFQNTVLMRYQHTPLTAIKKWLNIDGDIFDSVLVLQKYQSSQIQDSPWEVISDNATAEYAVSLEVVPQMDESMVLRLSSRNDVVPQEHARDLLLQFEDLMTETVLSLESAEERLYNRRISAVPARSISIDSPSLFLHELVEMSAAKVPNKVALEFATKIVDGKALKKVWTYSQIDKEGDKIAHLLISNQSQTGDLIGVSFHKCPEASFALLGVLKAGCAYVAIDPGLPLARKSFIINDAQCKILLTTRDLAPEFKGTNVRVLSVDDSSIFQDGLIDPKLFEKLTPLTPQHTCYCLYTSGTTGTPKGCLISHESAVQAMLSFQRIFRGRWEDNSRWLQFASFHFDVSVLEHFWSWSVGICVTSAPRELLFEDLPGTINALKITHLDLTPSLAGLLTPEEVPRLCQGVFIVGGEQVRQDIYDIWGDVGCLYNFYGPSEVTIGCTVRKQVQKLTHPTNIGQQWDNVGTFVLDPASEEPVIRGAVGELCLSGVLVGKGYLNRPQLTEAKFVQLKKYGERIYRTGDLVRLLYDDSFEYLGRIDDQVKLRGQRLQLGEINHVVKCASPSISYVASCVLKHPKQAKEQIVSFFSKTSNTGKPETCVMDPATEDSLINSIRKHCLDNLPAYMVPTYILPVSGIPLTTNNKADLRSLSSIFYQMSTETLQSLSTSEPREVSAPSSEESTVIDLLASYLGISSLTIKPSSRLFALGLDSIAAIDFAAKLRKDGFKSASTAVVMKYPVVSELAAALSKPSTNAAYDAAVKEAKERICLFEDKHKIAIALKIGVKPKHIDRIAPCTPLQEGMVFRALEKGHVNTGGRLPYFSELNFELASTVNVRNLVKAWNRVVATQQLLRTWLVPTADGYAQVVLSPNYDQEQASVVVLSEHEIDSHLHDTSWQRASIQDDKVSCGQMVILQTPANSYFSLHLFHGYYDGQSLALLLKKLAHSYLNPNIATRPDERQYHDAIPYGPLVHVPGVEDFWTRKLSGAPITLLPNSKDHTSVTTTTVVKSAWRFKKLSEARIKLNVTSSALFHAAFAISLNRFYSVSPTVGIVVSGRSIPLEGVENIVGPMLNTIPCPIEVRPGWKIEDMLKVCHDFNVDTLPYQHTSLSQISRWLKRSPQQPLFDVLFVFQKEDPSLARTKELWNELDNESVADYPLALEIEQAVAGEYKATIVAQGSYLDTRSAQLMLADMHQILEDVSSGVNRPLNIQNSSLGTHTDQNADTEPSAVYVSPEMFEWTPTTRKIREKIANLAAVQVDVVQPHTSIFELGLDSMDVIKLSARLRSSGILIPFGRILKQATIQKLSQYIEVQPKIKTKTQSTSDPTTHETSLISIAKAQGIDLSGVSRVLPVTPLQEGLLIDFAGTYTYRAFELMSTLDLNDLVRAWKRVTDSNPILRTSFVEIEDPSFKYVYAQLIHSAISVNFQKFAVKDLSSLDALVRTKTKIVVEKGLQFSAVDLNLVSVGETNQSVLLVGLSHAIYDGWSISLLLDDLTHCYFTNSCPQRPSYISHIEHAVVDPVADAREFWKQTLSCSQPTEFPRSQYSGKLQEEHQILRYKSEQTASIVQGFCKTQEITVQSLGLSCWAICLAQYTRSLAVCFNVVLSGRTMEYSEEMMFPTMNPIILPAIVAGTGAEMLRCMHDLAVRISEYQHFPLREAKRMVGSGAESIDTLFIYQKRPTTKQQGPEIWSELKNWGTPTHAVSVELEIENDAVFWTAASRNDILSSFGLSQILADIDGVLDFLISRTKSPLVQTEDDRVSICNLPAVQLSQRQAGMAGVGEAEIDVSTDAASPFSAKEAVVRQILSVVASMPLDQIKHDTSLYKIGLDSVSAIKVCALLKKESLVLPVSELIKAGTLKKIALVAREIETGNPRENPQKLGESAHSDPMSSEHKELLEKCGIPASEVDQLFCISAGQEYFLGIWRASGGRLFYPQFRFQTSSRLLRDRVSISMMNERLSQAIDLVPALRTTFIEKKTDSGVEWLQVVLKTNARSVKPPVRLFAEENSGGGLEIVLKLHHALYDAFSLKTIIRVIEASCTGSTGSFRIEYADPRPILVLTQGSDTTSVEKRRDFWTKYLGNRSSISDSIPHQGTFHAPRIEVFNPALLSKDETSGVLDALRKKELGMPAFFLAAYAQIHGRRLAEQDHTVIGIYIANRSLDIEGLPELACSTVNVLPLRVPLTASKVSSSSSSYIESLLQIAEQLQTDIAEISKSDLCGTTHRELYKWTGRRVNCVVNFLRTDDENSDSAIEQSLHCEGGTKLDQPRLRLISSEDLGDEEAAKSQGYDAPSPITGQFTDDVASVEWCLPTIDVEASVKNGVLAVGIFSPANMLQQEAAKDLVGELRRLLMVVRNV